MQNFLFGCLMGIAIIWFYSACEQTYLFWKSNRKEKKKPVKFEEKISYAKDRFLNNPITGRYNKGLNK